MKTPSVQERFWGKVDKSGDCWLWVAGKSHRYGSFNAGGGTKVASRVAWEIANGPIQSDALVCHSCDNPACVNPSHLFLGTQRDNMRDCSNKNRLNSAVGERNGRHRLTPIQVAIIRSCEGHLTTRQLADAFSVSHTTVSHILRGLRWNRTRQVTSR